MATLLYVDDEEALRRAVSTWMTRKGHTVLTAGAVAPACAILEQQHVDVVIVDLWLGEESGLEVHEWINEHRPDYSDRIVFVTGDVVATDRTDRALESLGSPVILKPFELATIEATVERLMHQPTTTPAGSDLGEDGGEDGASSPPSS